MGFQTKSITISLNEYTTRKFGCIIETGNAYSTFRLDLPADRVAQIIDVVGDLIVAATGDALGSFHNEAVAQIMGEPVNAAAIAPPKVQPDDI